MSGHFARLAALAEILFVLALGNIAGVMIYEALLPAAVVAGEASPTVTALYGGLRIFLRIGLVGAFGLGLLWFRRGLTPRDAGLTRAGKPLGHLIGIGILLGGFTSLLTAIVFAVYTLFPFGEGLAAWKDMRNSEINTAFFVELLATSIFIPPLVEEIMSRGYNRVRMVESYGPMGGVILTGLIFALAHTKFISSDPLLMVFMVITIIASISWTYVAQKTGSVIPSMVGHAMGNSIAVAILFNVWLPLAAVGALVAWQHRPIIAMLGQFKADWRADRQKSGLLYGILMMLGILGATMLAMSQFGRMAGMLGVGGLALLITIINIWKEKRSA